MQTSTFSRDHLGEKKVLESAFCSLSESLKSKIFAPLATMVLLPEYTRFITNLPFWATGRFERVRSPLEYHVM